MPTVRVRVSTDTRCDDVMRRLHELILSYPGNDAFEVMLYTSQGVRVLRWHAGVDSWDPDLRERLRETLDDL